MVSGMPQNHVPSVFDHLFSLGYFFNNSTFIKKKNYMDFAVNYHNFNFSLCLLLYCYVIIQGLLFYLSTQFFILVLKILKLIIILFTIELPSWKFKFISSLSRTNQIMFLLNLYLMLHLLIFGPNFGQSLHFQFEKIYYEKRISYRYYLVYLYTLCSFVIMCSATTTIITLHRPQIYINTKDGAIWFTSITIHTNLSLHDLCYLCHTLFSPDQEIQIKKSRFFDLMDCL